MKQILIKGLLTISLLTSICAVAAEADLDVVHRIKEEAFKRSKVMDYMHILADEVGPRVTGSPGYRQAAENAVAAYKNAGIKQAEIEPWGVFGRGWSWSRIALQMKTPHETTLVAYPGDWSPGTQGPVSGEVVFAPLWEEDERPKDSDLVKMALQIEKYKEKYRGTLAGKIVLFDHPASFELPENAPVYRRDGEALSKSSKHEEPGLIPPLEWPVIRYPKDSAERSRWRRNLPVEMAFDRWTLAARLESRLFEFLVSEGVSAVLIVGWGKVAGVIMHSNWGSYRDGDALPPPTAVVMPEHYNRIHRLVERDVPVLLQLDVDAQFHGPGTEGINVIAEIPGSGRDGELVMLGAHLDSWHGATGATDNAAGSAVVMEAMRILKALDLDMKRTVRAALWDGEEVCLCGSRAYVANNYADPVTMQLKPGHGKLSAYFNLDGGSGKIRGIFLQHNDMARPIMNAWMAPFSDMGVSMVSITDDYGTDHLSFNAVGIPAFNFEQDPLDYGVNTHHSNVDHVDHIIPGDLMQAAAVMAATVYHAATAAEMVPRKPLPKPLPPKNPLPEILQ